MAENDLFVKSEKYVWKVREVGFLGVVIELDKMKIEIERVVNCPVLRELKNMQKFLELANYYRQFVKDFARKTSSWDNKKEYKMKLGERTVEDIWGVEREFYNRATIGNTRLV